MSLTMRRITQHLYPKHIQFLKMSQVVGGGGNGGGGAKNGSGKVREADGNLDKIKGVREEEFFHKQKKEQLKNLKTKKETTKQKPNEKK